MSTTNTRSPRKQAMPWLVVILWTAQAAAIPSQAFPLDGTGQCCCPAHGVAIGSRCCRSHGESFREQEFGTKHGCCRRSAAKRESSDGHGAASHEACHCGAKCHCAGTKRHDRPPVIPNESGIKADGRTPVDLCVFVPPLDGDRLRGVAGDASPWVRCAVTSLQRCVLLSRFVC